MGDLNFAIDLPNPHNPDAEWVNYDYFDTREEAIAAAQDHFGADSEGRINLISELPKDN